jgi:hypothetical protein
MEEQPGPPLNQVANGAVVALFRASKNQNHMFSLPWILLLIAPLRRMEVYSLPTDKYPEY